MWLIFYGSSGGGFAALKAVGLLNNGVAIAINPQTDILKYKKFLEDIQYLIDNKELFIELATFIYDKLYN